MNSPGIKASSHFIDDFETFWSTATSGLTEKDVPVGSNSPDLENAAKLLNLNQNNRINNESTVDKIFEPSTPPLSTEAPFFCTSSDLSASKRTTSASKAQLLFESESNSNSNKNNNSNSNNNPMTTIFNGLDQYSYNYDAQNRINSSNSNSTSNSPQIRNVDRLANLASRTVLHTKLSTSSTNAAAAAKEHKLRNDAIHNPVMSPRDFAKETRERAMVVERRVERRRIAAKCIQKVWRSYVSWLLWKERIEWIREKVLYRRLSRALVFLTRTYKENQRMRAKGVLQRSLTRYYCRRKSAINGKYTQYGRWTIRQADIVLAAVLRWRVRRIMRDEKIKMRLREQEDMWQLLLDVADALGKNPQMPSDCDVSPNCIMRAISSYNCSSDNKDDNDSDNVDRLLRFAPSCTDWNFVRTIVKQIFNCRLSFRKLIFEGARWEVHPRPGYLNLSYSSTKIIVSGGSGSRGGRNNYSTTVGDNDQGGQISNTKIGIKPRSGITLRGGGGKKSTSSSISTASIQSDSSAATTTATAVTAATTTAVTAGIKDIKSPPTGSDFNASQSSLSSPSFSNISNQLKDVSKINPVKRDNSHTFTASVTSLPGQLGSSIPRRGMERAHLQIDVLGADGLPPPRGHSGGVSGLSEQSRKPYVTASLYLPKNNKFAGTSDSDSFTKAVGLNDLKRVQQISKPYSGEDGVNPRWDHTIDIPLTCPRGWRPVSSSSPATTTNSSLSNQHDSPPDEDEENNANIEVEEASLRKRLLDWWSLGCVKIEINDYERFNSETNLGEATLLLSSFLGPGARVKNPYQNDIGKDKDEDTDENTRNNAICLQSCGPLELRRKRATDRPGILHFRAYLHYGTRKGEQQEYQLHLSQQRRRLQSITTTTSVRRSTSSINNNNSRSSNSNPSASSNSPSPNPSLSHSPNTMSLGSNSPVNLSSYGLLSSPDNDNSPQQMRPIPQSTERPTLTISPHSRYKHEVRKKIRERVLERQSITSSMEGRMKSKSNEVNSKLQERAVVSQSMKNLPTASGASTISSSSNDITDVATSPGVTTGRLGKGRGSTAMIASVTNCLDILADVQQSTDGLLLSMKDHLNERQQEQITPIKEGVILDSISIASHTPSPASSSISLAVENESPTGEKEEKEGKEEKG